jgi:hypothetical protein
MVNRYPGLALDAFAASGLVKVFPGFLRSDDAFEPPPARHPVGHRALRIGCQVGGTT